MYVFPVDMIIYLFLRRIFIDINKQYIQDSRKERHKTHSEKNNEERKRDKPEAAMVYIYAKLSGIDLMSSLAYIQIKIRYLNVR